MTIKGEFLDIFDKWHEIADLEDVYILIVKWINRYKNIVKDQDSINDIIWRITMDEHDIMVNDFINGMCYASLREEINNMK